jgi:hypothetical protein
MASKEIIGKATFADTVSIRAANADKFGIKIAVEERSGLPLKVRSGPFRSCG